MKGAILICISLVIVGSVATKEKGLALSPAQSAEGIAAAWLFDEGSGKTIKDSVGGNDGEIKGSLTWTDKSKFGKSLQFPGQGDSYVWIAHNDIFDAEPYTFTAWVKLEAASWQYIAWREGETWQNQSDRRHLDIWVHDADYVVLMWNTEDGKDGRIDGKAIVADGNWHHVAKMSDGKNMKLYIDGKVDGEAPVGGKLVVNGEDALWIGARPGNVAATGIIDEVGFFTEALSEDELANVMTQGLDAIASVEPSCKLATTWGSIKNIF